MIAPDMATMLGFIFTDAAVAPDLLQDMLAAANRQSFSCITVDGDTSTSDTVLAFATGAGAAALSGWDSPGAQAFSAALVDLCGQLARLVVRDGEGASKLIEVRVSGAVDDGSAHVVAMSIANSPLVKTAIAGGVDRLDPVQPPVRGVSVLERQQTRHRLRDRVQRVLRVITRTTQVNDRRRLHGGDVLNGLHQARLTNAGFAGYQNRLSHARGRAGPAFAD